MPFARKWANLYPHSYPDDINEIENPPQAGTFRRSTPRKANFSSCQKICSEDVLNILEMSTSDIPSTKGMCVYLKLIQSVIIAYYEKETSLNDRLHHVWLSVFICRFWSAYLDTQSREKLKQQYLNQFSTLHASLSSDLSKKITLPDPAKMKTKQQFTSTHPCHYSIEINAHALRDGPPEYHINRRLKFFRIQIWWFHLIAREKWARKPEYQHVPMYLWETPRVAILTDHWKATFCLPISSYGFLPFGLTVRAAGHLKR